MLPARPHILKHTQFASEPGGDEGSAHSHVHARHSAGRPGEAEETNHSHFIGGVIRDGRTRMHTQPFAVDGPSWTPDFPLAGQEGQGTPSDTETAPPPPDLDTLRAEWEAEWQQQATAEREAAVAAARAEAYAAGFAAAGAELAAEREAERSAFAGDAAQLRTLWNNRLSTTEPLLVELAVDVAEAVVDGAITEEARAATAAAITNAVEHLAARPPLTVTLHPVDHLRLEEAGMVDALTGTHPGLRWVPDPSLAEGDWSLDAAGAAIRRIRSEVLHDLRVRLGLAVSDTEPEDEPQAADAASL